MTRDERLERAVAQLKRGPLTPEQVSALLDIVSILLELEDARDGVFAPVPDQPQPAPAPR